MTKLIDPFGEAEITEGGIRLKWIKGNDHATGAGSDLAEPVTDHVHVYDKNGDFAGKFNLTTGEPDTLLKRNFESGRVSRKKFMKNLDKLKEKIEKELNKGLKTAVAKVEKKLSKKSGKLAKKILKKVPVFGILVNLYFYAESVEEKGFVGGTADAVLDSIPFVGVVKGVGEICIGEDLIPDAEKVEEVE